MKTILLFGAPGAGKGTYGKLLSEQLGMKILSSGDLLRIKVKEAPLEWEKERKLMEQGELVDDQVVYNLVEPFLGERLIFDGFPRRVSQLKWLESKRRIDLVINCILDDEINLKKLLGRRICEDCGNGYNLCSIDEKGYKMNPLLPVKEGVCNKCSGKLVKREDDVEEIIKGRLASYYKLTEPILKVVTENSRVINFEPKRGVLDFPNLLKLI